MKAPVLLFFTSFFLQVAVLEAIETAKEELTTLYDYHRNTQSDIHEHIPILKQLAKECASVAEIGTGSNASTWSLLMGLSENMAPSRSFLEIQSKSPPLEKLYLVKRLAAENGIKYQYVQTTDVNFKLEEPVEFLFIDGEHTYCHLTHQLRTLSPKVTKYIAMHDTSPPWGYANDPNYRGDYSEFPSDIDRTKAGLSRAVEDFLGENSGWIIHERRMNNHGLFVLKRKEKTKMGVDPTIHVFIHTCTMNHWQEVLKRQLKRMKNSGLYDASATISLGVLGDGDVSSIKEMYPKVNVIYQDPNTAKYERPTLLSLHNWCKTYPDRIHVLYLHTKGITRTNPTVTDWTKFLEYFVIDQWKDCVQALKDHDVAGVNWQLGPQPHFSGNFWWATSAYVESLPHWIGTTYLDPEMWLCQNFPSFKCFHYSNVDHYYTAYPESKYVKADSSHSHGHVENFP
jgi:hypothetical protein